MINSSNDFLNIIAYLLLFSFIFNVHEFKRGKQINFGKRCALYMINVMCDITKTISTDLNKKLNENLIVVIVIVHAHYFHFP